MITKNDLGQLRKGLGKEIGDSANKLKEELKAEINASAKSLRKEFKEDIETAVVQVINAVIKHTASKEELKRVKGELSEKIDTIKSELSSEIKADTPTPQEFTSHEKRISKLESAVFPS